jgi:beta-lactamase class A
MKHILSRPIPAYLILLAFIFGLFFSVFFLSDLEWVKALKGENYNKATSNRLESSEYEFTKPLLFIDRKSEAKKFKAAKALIVEQIDALKAAGNIEEASVYFREFTNGEWMGIQEDAHYHPGSLLKIAVMLAAFQKAENDPVFLENRAIFEEPEVPFLPAQNYISDTIEFGKPYTVSELLRYTISNSDNKAYWLLSQMVEETAIDKVYKDLGMGPLKRGEDDGRVRSNARDYSKLLIALYNSTYTRPKYSEYGLSLMANCAFKNGMAKGLPPSVKLAHKFGEWDDSKTFELHESGIVYMDNKPYLITILTKGKSRETLPKAISTLTEVVYRELIGPKS